MTRTGAGTVTVREYTAGDLPAVLGLLRRCLAGGPTGRRDAALFRWKHHDNPFGRSLALVAVEHGRIVGLRTFMRWGFRLDGRPVAAVRAVDTATDPAARGRGVFTRLTRRALAQLEADGSADLVFNTPNDQSLPGYLKLGWRPVGTVGVAIRPVRPLRMLWGLRRGVPRGGPAGTPPPCDLPRAAEVLADRDAIIDLLAATGATPGRLATARTTDYLWWRYASPPGLDYRAVALREDGRLRGLALARPRRRGPLAELTLAEVLVRDGDTAGARALLRTVARRSGADHVATTLQAGGPAAGARRAAGYWRAPGTGMTLVVYPLRTLPRAPDDLDAWALSTGDLEVF